LLVGLGARRKGNPGERGRTRECPGRTTQNADGPTEVGHRVGGQVVGGLSSSWNSRMQQAALGGVQGSHLKGS